MAASLPPHPHPICWYVPSALGNPRCLIFIVPVGKPHYASGSWVKLISSTCASSHLIILEALSSFWTPPEPWLGSAPAPRAQSSIPTGPSPAWLGLCQRKRFQLPVNSLFLVGGSHGVGKCCPLGVYGGILCHLLPVPCPFCPGKPNWLVLPIHCSPPALHPCIPCPISPGKMVCRRRGPRQGTWITRQKQPTARKSQGKHCVCSDLLLST